jgi:hypothetical protein
MLKTPGNYVEVGRCSLVIVKFIISKFIETIVSTQPGQRPSINVEIINFTIYRSPHGYINQRLQIQFGAPNDERYAARNMSSL